jgi:hypothetical protein
MCKPGSMSLCGFLDRQFEIRDQQGKAIGAFLRMLRMTLLPMLLRYPSVLHLSGRLSSLSHC